jgi:hypothetical protein
MMAPAQLRDASLGSGGASELAYEEVARQIRALVEELTPVGAIVMVVSKGDEGLLRFDGRTGWHFPRAASGQYAGHHPPDGSWAVAQVEALRAAGGAYLVLPATYFWWLEHYPELDRHLRTRYERIPCAEEVCRIYRLLELPTAPPRAVPALFESRGSRQTVAAMRALVDNLLPDDEVVLVVSEGDDAMLAIDRQAWHFPHDAAGGHVPLEAAEGRHAVSQLRTLRGRGIRYLIVPADSYSALLRSRALAVYLGEECRTLARRDRVCVVYELRSSVRTPIPIVLRAKEAVNR